MKILTITSALATFAGATYAIPIEVRDREIIYINPDVTVIYSLEARASINNYRESRFIK
jgi:hypothetical protein